MFPVVAAARDLTLAETEQLVARSNRDVVAARRAVESAAAGILQADVRPNPVVSYNASGISNNPGIGPGSLTNKRIDNTFRIDQTLERGGKRDLRVNAAQGLERAARNDALDVLRQQLLLARAAYADLQQAQGKAEILAGIAELFGKTYSAAQLRQKAGDLAPADVARVQVDFERAQNDLRVAQAELARARLVLAQLVADEAAAADLRASDPWPPVTAPDATTIQQAIEARPDVLAAKSRIEATDKLRDLARSQRTRDVSVGAQFERYPGTQPVNSIGFGVSVPLFLGNDFSGDIQRAEVDRYSALDALERARAVAGAEIARAASDLKAAGERRARYDGSLLAAAQRSADAAEFAFQRGATSVLEVLDARRTLRAVQLEALGARADYAKALYAWQASLQSAATLPQPARPPQ
ncbi:MAG: TolC family protein [Proteobacteria bacterium]|nr:TolC family protein [Pseudomonadota bacterium]